MPFLGLLSEQVRHDLRDVAARRVRIHGEGGHRRLARIHSIGDMRAAARKALPRQVFDFVEGGSGREITQARNERDLANIQLLPRVMRDVTDVDTSTTVLGQRIALPAIAAPTGLTALVHPDGEKAVARGARDAGTTYLVSAAASWELEEVARESDGLGWFQIFIWRDRELVRALIDRAGTAGCRALAVSVDVPVSGRRTRDLRNGFSIPPRISLRSLLEGVRHPRWAFDFARQPPIRLANVGSQSGLSSFSTLVNDQMDPAVTWADLDWIRALWKGPLLVKGILDAEDAAMAVGRGADAVVVSNHGGRQLDRVSSTISALPAIVDAVGSDAEVLVDGGFRSGEDIAAALALGARACLIGRPPLYGLAVAGQSGVTRSFQLLQQELKTTMALVGCTSVDELAGHALIRR